MSDAIQTAACQGGHLATVDTSLPFPQRCEVCGAEVSLPVVQRKKRFNPNALIADTGYAKRGGLSSVYACRWCSHVETIRLGLRGVGRGYGFAEGNRARGRLIQHVKSAHPDEYRAERMKQRRDEYVCPSCGTHRETTVEPCPGCGRRP